MTSFIEGPPSKTSLELEIEKLQARRAKITLEQVEWIRRRVVRELGYFDIITPRELDEAIEACEEELLAIKTDLDRHLATLGTPGNH